MGNGRTFSRTILISLLYLVVQILSVWALMRAYRFDLSVLGGGGRDDRGPLRDGDPQRAGEPGSFQAVW